jgi:hypothetical protein
LLDEHSPVTIANVSTGEKKNFPGSLNPPKIKYLPHLAMYTFDQMQKRTISI